MGNIITLLGKQHLETQSLLPWYVSGRLEGSDRARVETHLAECPECRADLAGERRLAAEWAAMPVETEASWLSLRARLVREEAARAKTSAISRLLARAREIVTDRRPAYVGAGWAVAAAMAFALVATGVSFRAPAPAAAYHALGAAPAPTAGNVLVMFDPETSERRFRDALEAGHARLVDGPTAGGAYVLHVPAGERAAALAELRRRPDVELAQPIDPGVIR